MHPPEYVLPPEPGLEKQLVLNSLDRLRDIRAGRIASEEICMPGGVEIATKLNATGLSRTIRTTWEAKYPELSKRRSLRRLKDFLLV